MALVQASFTITVPPPQSFYNPPIKRLLFFDGFLLSCASMNFVNEDYPNGVTGVDANDKAQNLADHMNFLSLSPSVVSLRDNNNLLANVSGNIVTVNLLIDDTCCGKEGSMTNLDEGELSQYPPQFVGAVTPIQCEQLVDIPDMNCANYPPNSFIYRFQFINDSGTTFGQYSTSWFYFIEVNITGTPICRAVGQYEIIPGLATTAYNSYAEFLEGWPVQLSTYWGPVYNGYATHLGNGIMEVVTDIQLWNDRTGSDICSVGMEVNCGYYGEVITPGLSTYFVDELCCAGIPPPPPDATIDKPVITELPKYLLPAECFFVQDFACVHTNVVLIEKLYYLPFSCYMSSYWDNDDVITQLNTTTSQWRTYSLNKGTTLEVTNEHTSKGIRWLHSVTGGYEQMNYIHRRVMLQMLHQRLLVVIKDYNGIYWLLGEQEGMRFQELASVNTAEYNGNNWKLTCNSRYYAKTIAKSLGENIETQAEYALNCASLVGVPLAGYTLFELSDCFLFDMRNNFLS